MSTFRFGQLIETSVQKKVMGACHATNGGVLPVTGFPHDGDKVKEGNVHRQIKHGASTSISYITHALVHGRSSRRLYLSERALSERIKFEAEKGK